MIMIHMYDWSLDSSLYWSMFEKDEWLMYINQSWLSNSLTIHILWRLHHLHFSFPSPPWHLSSSFNASKRAQSKFSFSDWPILSNLFILLAIYSFIFSFYSYILEKKRCSSFLLLSTLVFIKWHHHRLQFQVVHRTNINIVTDISQCNNNLVLVFCSLWILILSSPSFRSRP